MRILAVDDEELMLGALTDCIRKASPESEIIPFRKSREALVYAIENPVDVAFLDIRMRGMDGLELGKALLQLYPEMNLIYCTSYDEFVSDAFREIRCNGYITKPVDVERVREELDHLRVPLTANKEHKVVIRCMGRFEIYVDDEPIKFEYSKTKECLAYLVNACGGICGNQEIIANLWDDDLRHDSYFKRIRKDLISTLERYGCENILYKQRGGLGINTSMVTCDYYQWRKDNERNTTEYMTQYSWASVKDYEW